MRKLLKATIGELYDPVPDQLFIVDHETIEVVEIEPSRRTFRFDAGREYHTANWPLPYMQFAFFLNHLAVYFSSTPKESLTATPSSDQELCLTPFPNQYEDGLVCQQTAKNIEEAIAIFFGSPFEGPACWAGPVAFASRGLKLNPSPSLPFNEMFSDAWEKLSVDDMLAFRWPIVTLPAHIHRVWRGQIEPIGDLTDNPWGQGTIFPFVMRSVLSEKH
jgi:hypothetical protein